jgi:hypothetical protein
MDMPRPTAAHEQLRKITGSWHGEERMLPSPWDPTGGVATGRVRNASALDGFIVVQDYEQERDGRVVFRGHGVFWWDAAEATVVLHWFDSMGQAPNEFRGTFRDDVLSLVSKSARGATRATWDYRQDGRCVHRMEMSPDGVQWRLFMEGSYTRDEP